MRMQTTLRNKILAAAVVVLVIVLIIVLSGTRPDKREEVDLTAEIAEGVAWLKRQEARDPSEVDAQIKAMRQAEWEAMLLSQRDDWVAQLENGEINVWSLFEDAVILGDSRVVGYEFYDFLPTERVMAEGGATIRNVEALVPELQTLNPAQVFLCYGLNDISIGYWSTAEEYVTELDQVIQLLQAALPDATICVSSTLIARDPAFQKASAWRRIPEWNIAIAQMCEEKGYPYADNTQLCEDYAELWETDGIHVQRTLYQHWAKNLMIEVYDYALGKLEAPTD